MAHADNNRADRPLSHRYTSGSSQEVAFLLSESCENAPTVPYHSVSQISGLCRLRFPATRSIRVGESDSAHCIMNGTSSDSLIAARQRFFAYVHVPKTAGTSFIKALGRNFPRDQFIYEPWYLQIAEDRLDARRFDLLLKLHPTLRAYCSHKISLNLPFDVSDRNIIAIAHVRDPIERFVSSYFFERTEPFEFIPAVKTTTLSQFIELVASGNLKFPVELVRATTLCSQALYLTDLTDQAAMQQIESSVGSEAADPHSNRPL